MKVQKTINPSIPGNIHIIRNTQHSQILSWKSSHGKTKKNARIFFSLAQRRVVQCRWPRESVIVSQPGRKEVINSPLRTTMCTAQTLLQMKLQWKQCQDIVKLSSPLRLALNLVICKLLLQILFRKYFNKSSRIIFADFLNKLSFWKKCRFRSISAK